MQPLVLLPFLVASALAGNLYGAVPVVQSVEPVPQYTQEQNTATGEYGYSYYGGPSAKTEYRATDGTTTGTYSYVDAHGILQTVSYIADEFGFRAAGSNIPTEGSVPLDAPDVAAAKAAHLAEHSRATLEALSHNRRKRGAILPAVSVAALPVAHAAIPIPVAHAALPVATSSQHHVQIYNSGHLLTSHSLLYRKKRGIAAYAVPLPASSAKIYRELAQQPLLRAAPLATHAIAAPAAIAAPLASHTVVESLPLATSSQSRFQVHNGAKIVQEISTPVLAAAPIVEAKAALPVASHTVVESLPLATSSQSRFQVHNGAKVVQEISTPVLPAATVVEARAALPVASHTVVESLPLATSSQRRFQVHNGAKIIQEFHQPLYAAAAVPALPAVAPALPAFAPALPAAPVYPGSLQHEVGASAGALPAEAASAGEDAITVESA